MPKSLEQKNLYQQVREVALNRGRVVVYNQWTRHDYFLDGSILLPVWVETLLSDDNFSVAITAIAYRHSWGLPATVELKLSNLPEVLVLNGDKQRIFQKGRQTDHFLRNATPQDLEFWTPFARLVSRHPNTQIKVGF